MLTFLTAGESHGKGLVVIIEGIPAGVPFSVRDISSELQRRRGSVGRGERSKIEKDRVEIVSGVRGGATTGAPVSVLIENLEWEKWESVMSVESGKGGGLYFPRPGHGDLPGAVKYGVKDFRNISERGSARETASRVAAGALAKKVLNCFGVSILSHVVEIGGERISRVRGDLLGFLRKADKSPLRCGDKRAELRMMRRVEKARKAGDSLGGIFEVIASGVLPGLGGFSQWSARLDGKLAMALMSIHGVKGVEVGLGFGYAGKTGSEVHDEIVPKGRRLSRSSNNAGGIEGGMTNGENIVLRAVMKPIPTLAHPLKSVDLRTLKPGRAEKMRADVCAVPSCAVVGESMVGIEILSCYLEKFGGDTLGESLRNARSYASEVRKLFHIG